MENPYVKLAREAVEKFIKEKRIIEPPDWLPEEFFKEKAGTFVTIEREGQLRGCIGTWLPTKENIAKEIISNAILAATKDFRFKPIETNELPLLNFKVYILEKPKLVKKISQLDPKKYGILVKAFPQSWFKKGDFVFDGKMPIKTGILLPDLEGIDTPQKQVFIACQKGGIDILREKILIYKFKVKKFSD